MRPWTPEKKIRMGSDAEIGRPRPRRNEDVDRTEQVAYLFFQFVCYEVPCKNYPEPSNLSPQARARSTAVRGCLLVAAKSAAFFWHTSITPFS